KSGPSVYDIVTSKIVTALEAGVIPWQKPWAAGDHHKNLVSKQPYTGINTWLTGIAAEANGYTSPWWVTLKQANELGGKVRKGEKGTQIVFWSFVEAKDEKDAEGNPKRRGFLLYNYVFNTDQCDMPEGVVPQVEPTNTGSRIREDEAVANAFLASGPTLQTG